MRMISKISKMKEVTIMNETEQDQQDKGQTDGEDSNEENMESNLNHKKIS